MPAERLPMRKVREVLRLKHACGVSERVIARSLGVGRRTVAEYLRRAEVAGCPGRCLKVWTRRRWSGCSSRRRALMPVRAPQPDWAAVHRELKRPGVTLPLLWDEYRGRHPDGYGYGLLRALRRWRGGSRRSCARRHVAGERMFVDYAGTR